MMCSVFFLLSVLILMFRVTYIFVFKLLLMLVGQAD